MSAAFSDEHKKNNHQPVSDRDNSTFINNAQNHSAKTLSNLVETPSITLPKGGGAIKSIDEKFSVNNANGTASWSVPLPFSPGRSGFTPSLSLNYNSGSGNSVFGTGWSAEVSCIQRKTEKKLPEYKDSEESDTFIMAGAENLVPELIDDTEARNTVTINGVTTTRYRPRMEGAFFRIEKIQDGGNVYWKVTTKDNVVSVYGQSDEAKLFSPLAGEHTKIFKWYLEFTYDNKGNFTHYIYKKENEDNVAVSSFEKNRLQQLAPFTNIYLKKVRYANKVPFYEGNPRPDEFLFEMVFDYGEHDKDKPTTSAAVTDNNEVKWPVRKDAFSDYRAGFEIRTYRLCRRVLMFHHFEAALGLKDYLVKSLEFNYDEQFHLSYLESFVQTGYIWNGDGSLQSKKTLPPLQFTYNKPGFSKEVKEISPENREHAPVGIDNQKYQWTDLYSEGISGILSEQATGWFYKENNGNGQFSNAKLVSLKPTAAGLSNGSLSIEDMEANGKKYLVSRTPGLYGYFELLPEEWSPFSPFTNHLNIDLKDPNLKQLDLDGDGIADILISHEQQFVWHLSKGKAGYDDYRIAAKTNDDEKGPAIVFSDKDQQMMIAIADMSGDGLSDIVIITYDSVCYYPNLGYGRFGAKVSMELNGCFDNVTGFNPQFIHLADIDGSGTTDIVYTANDSIQVWFNLSGNRFSEPSEIFNPFPQIDSESKISCIDLLGNGTNCLVWSSPLPAHSYAPLRYIDMMGGQKPHLMTGYKNNLGKEISLEYRSSTHFYLEDKKKGKKWITRLPFPVQCISKVITVDKVSQTRFTKEYSYHHGYYDAIEREYRGFAMVEERDSELYDHFVKETLAGGLLNTKEKKLFQAPVITRTWFHTGAYFGRNNFFHSLADEYYPKVLVLSGKITDPAVAGTLQKYILSEGEFEQNLNADELIECCRALKGLPLRQEVYSEEGSTELQLHPYSVTQYNYDIQCLQHRHKEKYGVFLSHELENLVFHYERNPLDPRISHTINTEIDEYGNVKQAATIVYGRKQADPDLPTQADRDVQLKQHITYSSHLFTKKIDTPQAYRLPVNWSSQTWELNTAVPKDTFFTGAEIMERFANAGIKQYEETTLINEKRKIEQAATLFLRDDLSGPEDPGSTGTLGLPYENYLLAFTPGLVNDMYGNRVTESILRDKGKYVEFRDDDNYWIRSGRLYFHPDLSADPFVKIINPPGAADLLFAKNNFYQAVAYEDNSRNLTKVFYDPCHYAVIRRIDAADNEINIDVFHYRTLAACRLRDENDNISGVRFDELGMVTHTFAMGKENEFQGDWMEPATIESSVNDRPGSVLEYEFRYFNTNGLLPDRTKISVREKHHFKGTTGLNGLPEIENDTRSHVSYSYSDGSGHEVLKKVQAEPGLAPVRDAQGKLVKDALGKLQQADTTPALRWVGNGRTITNNKGNPVMQYEPYFDSSPEYNDETELVELGCTAIIYYDALDRVIRKENPNGTFTKTVFDAWMQRTWDENDTVLDDACQWYKDRINGGKGPVEQQAAQKSALHNDTPLVESLDSLARLFLHVKHNRTQRTGEAAIENFYYTRNYFDIEGSLLRVTHVKNAVETEVTNWRYDMLGNICRQHSSDAGNRWILQDASARSLRLWDNRSNTFSYEYDALNRPLTIAVDDGAGEKVFEKREYGEGAAGAKDKNLRGKLFRHFDTGGLVVHEQFDFKGNGLRTTRQLPVDYKGMPDWKTTTVENETFANETGFDALNRPVLLKYPDNSIITPVYNEAGLLNSLDVNIKGVQTITHFITNIDYNEKGQRQKIEYGNDTANTITTTTYRYEPETFRLTQLLTIKNSDNTILQDLTYTYDPVGNITRQFDDAQKTIFYGGQKVAAENNYIYDALYQLVEANGREHIGQIGLNTQDNWNDSWSGVSLQPASPVQLRNYTQKYAYDEAGNILEMRHIAGPASWTRTYRYNAFNNQLTRTEVGNQGYDYLYNEHGSMHTMPHLQPGTVIDWNVREEMQHIQLGGGGQAWYQYDGTGQRIRKTVERNQQREERIYLDGIEIYRVYQINTTNKLLERETLHVTDDKRRIAMVDTRTASNDGSPQQLIRFQYNDHLSSACLELDEQAKIISYEEYHPFGTTAYQATDASRQVPAKRYRYTGMERDDESGFNYHHARYYVPWLGRWINTDPIGIKDGLNLYEYARNCPIRLIDPDGTLSTDNQKFVDDSKIYLDSRITGLEKNIKKTTDTVDKQWADEKEYRDAKAGKEYDKKSAKFKKSISRQGYIDKKFAESKNEELKNRKVDELKAQVDKLKTLKNFFDTHKFSDDSLILANVVVNEAGVKPQGSKLAIAYAWLNRAGGPPVREPVGAEVSDYVSVQDRLSSFSQDSDKDLFLSQYKDSIAAADQRLADKTPKANDPTKGSTHWISPDAKIFDKRNGENTHERVINKKTRFVPEWARANNDKDIKRLQTGKHAILNKDFHELSGISGFLFYKGVK